MNTDFDVNRNLFNSLDAPAYPIMVTSRLVGITRWRVSRYLKGYDFTYLTKRGYHKKHQLPVVTPTMARPKYASFLDLVDLLYVKELLNRGFQLPYIRLALDEAKMYVGTPHFARSIFYTSGSDILLKIPSDGYLIALLRGGQLAINEIMEEIGQKLDFTEMEEGGFARRWYPRGKNGYIVIDPQISFGRPTVIGHGITTRNIYSLFKGENEQIEPVSEWFRIPKTEIQAAVQFEHSLWM